MNRSPTACCGNLSIYAVNYIPSCVSQRRPWPVQQQIVTITVTNPQQAVGDPVGRPDMLCYNPICRVSLALKRVRNPTYIHSATTNKMLRYAQHDTNNKSLMKITHCICHNISFAEIKALADEKHISDVETLLTTLQQELPFGDNCQTCLPYIRRTLATGQTEFNEILLD